MGLGLGLPLAVCLSVDGCLSAVHVSGLGCLSAVGVLEVISLEFLKLKFISMFDFEKLEVYQEIRQLNKTLLPEIFKLQKDYPYLADQLKRASLSVQLNLAEGTGRMSGPDKKQFYIRSRSSVAECVAILHTLNDLNVIKNNTFATLYSSYEKVSKMMLGMIRSL